MAKQRELYCFISDNTGKYYQANQQVDGSWLLEVVVNSIEPVQRIIRSLPLDIKLL